MRCIISKLYVAALILFIAFCFGLHQAQAQNLPGKQLREVLNKVAAYNALSTPEKIYVQLDKPAYGRGDTLWFKAYVFDASSLNATTKSGIMYLEIADAENRVIRRQMAVLTVGLGWGNIALNERDFPDGNYTLRAYTNWLRNFDAQYIFTQTFTITGIAGTNWLISSGFRLTQQNALSNVSGNLKFTTTANTPAVAEPLKVKVLSGKSTLLRSQLLTGVEGTADFNFNVPDKADLRRLSLQLTRTGKGIDGAVYTVPVVLNRDSKIDLQFMPEGGSLIAGIKNRIAFKALTEDGRGINISGLIYNSKAQQVAVFKSAHLGMGAFYFTPLPGEVYTAKVKLFNSENTYRLPAVKSSGILLGIDNATADSLHITLTPTADVVQAGAAYYLIGQSRGIVCYGAVFEAGKGAKSFSVSRNVFPTGTARFTLISASKQAVCERVVFIDHHDQIRLNVNPLREFYGKRDSVVLNITSVDKDGDPVQGVFSVAVTDDAQVKPDTASSIVSKILLEDDLKGHVENPDWYFSETPVPEKEAALDNLMLAQGWVNYNWDNVFKPVTTPLFEPEHEFVVRGKVSNIFNKPVAQTSVLLMTKKPLMLIDTLTDNAGMFNFTDLHPADTAVYIIQARNKKGKSFNVGIDMEDFKPPVFSPDTQRYIPWYVNMDTLRQKNLQNRYNYQLEQNKILGIHQLKEVKIIDKKIIKDSKNLNEDGGSDFAMDEADIGKAGKVTLKQLLEKNIKGFTDNISFRRYVLHIDQEVHMLIDGVSLDFFYDGSQRKDDFYDEWLNYIDAADVKGIELMSSMRYSSSYFTRYQNPMDTPWKHAYIEVTTYSGNGAFMKKTPGFTLYKPLVFASQKQFYSPRYAIKTTSPFMDMRSTLFWEPNVITNKDGKATVSFYTGDKTGRFSVWIQGSDMTGDLGAGQGKLVVKEGT